MNRSLKDIVVQDFNNSIKITYDSGRVKRFTYDSFLNHLIQTNSGLFYHETNRHHQIMLFPARTNKYWM